MKCSCCTNEAKENCKLCKSCIDYRKNYNKTHPKQRLKTQATFRENHRDEINQWYSDEFKKLKNIILDHYGHKCACCPETIYEFLTVDHINNDGAKHRKSLGNIGKSGRLFYKWIIDNNFPKDLQIMCWNCNWAKWRYGKCPHQK